MSTLVLAVAVSIPPHAFELYAVVFVRPYSVDLRCGLGAFLVILSRLVTARVLLIMYLACAESVPESAL